MPRSADVAKRLKLTQQLSSLPPPQLSQIIFALDIPPENVPADAAAPGDRVTALLSWAESGIGCGLPIVEQVLGEILGEHTPETDAADTSAKTTRIFISYRSQTPDQGLAQSFYQALSAAGHQAFLAESSIKLGEQWAQRILQELEQSDYFLLLLSPQSVTSEMVMGEVQRAKELQEERGQQRPIILPVRVKFALSSPLTYILRGYLDRI
ncbi:MAG: toll/interleukin-1 receptor domain-containing protein, partial [Cyanobacteria bacterium P01_H01_bin.153]